jgi:hypothetical protein
MEEQEGVSREWLGQGWVAVHRKQLVMPGVSEWGDLLIPHWRHLCKSQRFKKQ